MFHQNTADLLYHLHRSTLFCVGQVLYCLPGSVQGLAFLRTCAVRSLHQRPEKWSVKSVLHFCGRCLDKLVNECNVIHRNLRKVYRMKMEWDLPVNTLKFHYLRCDNFWPMSGMRPENDQMALFRTMTGRTEGSYYS